ncbi:MAG TPA: class I SAM-dependent methyltransferase [Polyangia bacterium]|nr:class I SAM-dependent methyltransferase [Polyangia bacterium]
MVQRPAREYYDEFADWYERERAGPGYHALIDGLEAELACRYGAGAGVLEAGCGSGLILQRVALVARRAHGVDLSRGMLARADERGLAVAQSDLCALPFPAHHFDLVYSFKVLAHVEPIERALSELVRVTRPGGHLLLEFYNPRSLRYLVRRLRPPRPISERTREDAVFTRFDTLGDVKRYLPPGVTVLGVRGVRVLTPLPQLHKLPLLGRVLGALETWAADAPALRRLGGFLIVIARKDS